MTETTEELNEIAINDLYPALVQCFGTIACGWVFDGLWSVFAERLINWIAFHGEQVHCGTIENHNKWRNEGAQHIRWNICLAFTDIHLIGGVELAYRQLDVPAGDSHLEIDNIFGCRNNISFDDATIKLRQSWHSVDILYAK